MRIVQTTHETPFTLLESATDAAGLLKLALPTAPSGSVAARPATSDHPLDELVDGLLTTGYGPVFSNGVRDGAYRVDLGVTKKVAAITSWSFNHSGRRGRQVFTLYGSNAPTDPGWNTADTAVFTPLGSIDTASVPGGNFLAASLRARAGKSLGSFRWIVWQTSPVTVAAENTAWQEFSIVTPS